MLARLCFAALAAVWCLVQSGPAAAQMTHSHGAKKKGPVCVGTGLECASVATPAFAPDGSLWIVWMADDRILVARSTDLGRSFSPAKSITPAADSLDRGADSRPQIVVDRAGRIVVTYTQFKREGFIGRIMVSRSTDGGATFSPPRPITDDLAGQRFEALGVDPQGRLFMTWIDKRTAFAVKQAGKEYPGAALVFAWSEDGGASFSPLRIAQENSCECCRLGVTFNPAGQAVVLFRNVYGAMTRDHAVTTFADPQTPGPVHRVSVDNWEIDACPHHGPSLSVSASNTYHVAWYTDGKARQGLFYARSADGGRSFSDPAPIGDADRQPSRPQLLSLAGTLWMAWKEFDGQRTTVLVKRSLDDGKTWSAPRAVAEAADHSDHPLLISDGRRVFLSWQAQIEGYRLLWLEDRS